MARNVLAIDPARQMGWARTVGGVLTSGTIDLRPRYKQWHGYKWLNYVNFLKPHLQEIDVIVIEDVMIEPVRTHARGHISVKGEKIKEIMASHSYGGFRAITELICVSGAKEFYSIPVKTIKKYATGAGDASKEMMLDHARLVWPKQNVIDDNQADALWILDCYLDEMKLKDATKENK